MVGFRGLTQLNQVSSRSTDFQCCFDVSNPESGDFNFTPTFLCERVAPSISVGGCPKGDRGETRFQEGLVLVGKSFVEGLTGLILSGT